MTGDVQAAAVFYRTARGGVVARLLRTRLSEMWPDLKGQAVLGIGYAPPFLRLWRPSAARCVAVTLAQMGAVQWLDGEANRSCMAEEDALPFPDLTFDRVLLVHALESAESSRRLLRETWRVMKDDGRLMVVVPNRTGVWAYRETTPFGNGRPFSFSQLERQLAGSLFRIERRDAALRFADEERRGTGSSVVSITGSWRPEAES